MYIFFKYRLSVTGKNVYIFLRMNTDFVYSHTNRKSIACFLIESSNTLKDIQLFDEFVICLNMYFEIYRTEVTYFNESVYFFVLTS